ncbi:MAG: serine/threonine-protein phosphatase [Anaerolineae bacterium]|nr:serine/threonine-protein phosphatase [Anaerolineae bacterium]
MTTSFIGALDLAELTDVGLKRQRNEDASRMLVPPASAPESKFGALFMVADGMGGLGGGDVASRSAIDEIVHYYYDLRNREPDPAARLQSALESANIHVREQANAVGLPRIGSTAAGVVLTADGEAVVFNVGDCRVYRVRNGQIERLSRDQSVMERQIEAGIMTEEAARAMRNSMVTAFLGQPLPIVPYFHRVKVQPGDTFIICSDGLWGLAEADELLRIMRNTPSRTAVRKFVNLALSRGGNDNITAVVVRLGNPPARRLSWLLPLLALIVVAAVVGVLVVLSRNREGGGSGLLAGGDGGSPTATETPQGSSFTLTPPTGDTLLAPALGSPTGATTAAATVELIQLVPTFTPTRGATLTPSATDAPPPSATFTATTGPTPTRPFTLTPSDTATFTPTFTASWTTTPSRTPSLTLTATITASATPTATFSATPSRTVTTFPSLTRTPTATATRTATPTLAPTRTLSPALVKTISTPTLVPSPTLRKTVSR